MSQPDGERNIKHVSHPSQQRHVLIVGGGVIGLSIAWRLAQEGNCVVSLCEKGRVGGEASWAAAGMLSPGGEFVARSEQTAFALESRAAFRGFIRELEGASGKSIDYQECGALELARSAEELGALERKATEQSRLGIESKAVTPKQVATFWPRLQASRFGGARFYPGDGAVDPRVLIGALELAARRAGVSVLEHCVVKEIAVRGDGVHVACSPGNLRYDAAVIAAGAWSSSIPLMGVPAVPETQPMKGQVISYQQPANTCGTIIRQGHRYMLQRSNGMLIVGASMERAGFDRTISGAITRDLAAWAGSVLPHLMETTPSTSWIGFRPAAEQVQLGRWHSERLFLAYGHFRNGILLAPATAQRVVGAVTASLEKLSAALA